MASMGFLRRYTAGVGESDWLRRLEFRIISSTGDKGKPRITGKGNSTSSVIELLVASSAINIPFLDSRMTNHVTTTAVSELNLAQKQSLISVVRVNVRMILEFHSIHIEIGRQHFWSNKVPVHYFQMVLGLGVNPFGVPKVGCVVRIPHEAL